MILLTLEESAARLRVSKSTLIREIFCGKLRVVRFRSTLRIDERDLMNYVEDCKIRRDHNCQRSREVTFGMLASKRKAKSSTSLWDLLEQEKTPKDLKQGFAQKS